MKNKIQILIGCVLAMCLSFQAFGLTQAEKDAIRAKFNPTAEEIAKSIPQGFFPVGMCYGDNCILRSGSIIMNDDMNLRREKNYNHFAHLNINTLLPENVVITPPITRLAEKYGLKMIGTCHMIYAYMTREDMVKMEPKTLAQTKEYWKKHVELNKNDPNILAWFFLDEPLPSMCGTVSEMTRYISELDPTRPVIHTWQSLPLESVPEWEALAACKVICTDHYSICEAFGRNPWSYKWALESFSEPNPNAPQWPIIQFFQYVYQPTIPELRIMIWHTISGGAKGLIYYSTGENSASWPCENNRDYECPGNLFFGDDAYFDEITRANELLNSAGPLLIPLTYQKDFAVTATPNETYDAKAHMGKTKHSYERFLNGHETLPVFNVGCFAGNDYDVLVISNNDPDTWHTGALKFPTKNGRGNLYDLRTLSPVKQNADGFVFHLAPGDGGLYLWGNENSFQLVKPQILARRFCQAKRILELDAARAQKAGNVDISECTKAIAEAAKVPVERSLAALQKAREALIKAECSNATYSAIKNSLNQSRVVLSKIDARLTELPRTLTFADLSTDLQAFIKQVFAVGIDFTKFENDFWAGKASLEQATEIRIKCENLFYAMPAL